MCQQCVLVARKAENVQAVPTEAQAVEGGE